MIEEYLTLVNALWLIMALLGALIILRLNGQRGNGYQFVDVLKGSDGRASLTNHILLMMALMSVWICIDRSNDGKDVDTLVLGVLGIFVVGKTVTQSIDKIKEGK